MVKLKIKEIEIDYDIYPRQKLNQKTVEEYKEKLESGVIFPSVVSELHFYLMTRDSGLFKVFPYYTYDDIRIGIDFRVSYDHKIHNIHLGLKSKNEAVFREIKKKRKEDRNEEVIDFYLDPGCALSVGGVWLHKPKDVEHLKEVIIKETNNAQ